MYKQSLILILTTAAALSAQTSNIAAVYDLIGQSTLCSPDSVWVYGTFPADNRTSFSATVGGETAPVNLIATQGGVGVEINIEIPTDLAPGPSNVVILHNGTPSNTFPITISSVCPAIAADGTAFTHANGAQVTTAFPAAPGEAINLIMSGLGHTNPIQPLGATTNAALAAAITPTVTVAGANATVQFAGQPAGTVGYSARVTFIVPPGAPSGADQVLVATSGVQSNPVQLMVGTTQLPSAPKITALANAASYQTKPIAPGSFLTILATGLTGKDNLSAALATSTNGYAVQIGAWQAPISALDLSQGVINVVVPAEAPAYGTLPVTIQSPNGPAAGAIAMGATAPGIFLIPDPSSPSRTNAAALLNGTAWIVMPASQTAALGLTACAGLSPLASCGQPAHPGDIVQLYVTGLGNATPNGNPNLPPLPTGQPAPASGTPLYETTGSPTLTVNGIAAHVFFSGVAPGFAGLYQIDFQVPAGTSAGDNVPVQVSIGGNLSAIATLAVQ
jgi:uncharacterized protein (TIGR03437 family)